jgi:hypothetical protein
MTPTAIGYAFWGRMVKVQNYRSISPKPSKADNKWKFKQTANLEKLLNGSKRHNNSQDNLFEVHYYMRSLKIFLFRTE